VTVFNNTSAVRTVHTINSDNKSPEPLFPEASATRWLMCYRTGWSDRTKSETNTGLNYSHSYVMVSGLPMAYPIKPLQVYISRDGRSKQLGEYYSSVYRLPPVLVPGRSTII